MNEQTLLAIAERIATHDRFAGGLSETGRVWFALRTIRQKQTGTSDIEALEQAALSRLMEAKDIVEEQLLPREKSANDSEKAKRRWLNPRIAQIAYGLLGLWHQFYQEGNRSYFTAILDRRVRAIERIRYRVNPNSRGYFRYPSQADPHELNPDAAPYWDAQRGQLTDLGRAAPAEALKKVFTDPPRAANKLHCSQVANLIDLEALLVMEDPQSELDRMVSNGDQYIDFKELFPEVLAFILEDVEQGNYVQVPIRDNPNLKLKLAPGQKIRVVDSGNSELATIEAVAPDGSSITFTRLTGSYRAGGMLWPNTRFKALSDPRPQFGWFENRLIDIDELIVGDHLQLTNHPLYLYLVPNGSWSGEHVFVTRRWVGRAGRYKPKVTGASDVLPWKKETTVVQGHGMRPMRLEVAAQRKLLAQLNATLAFLIKELKQHLRQNPNDPGPFVVTYRQNTIYLLRDSDKEADLSTRHNIKSHHCWYLLYPHQQPHYLYRLDESLAGAGGRKARGFLKPHLFRFQDLSGLPLFRHGSSDPRKAFVRRPRVEPFE